MELTQIVKTREGKRLDENRQRTAHWNRWGSFLSERAWGTVREDYSPFGTAWDYFPTTTLARRHTDGMRMDWATAAIAIGGSASPLPCGMAGTRS
jgi:hypothetical protein